MLQYINRSITLSLLAVLFGLLTSSASQAKCDFSVSTADSVWHFEANAGDDQSRSFMVYNTTTETLVLELSLSGSEVFSVTPHRDSLASGDSLSVTITFKPGSNVAAGTSSHSLLTISEAGASCHFYLALNGTVSGSNNHGGGDQTVLFDPSKFSFGANVSGSDTCHSFRFYNHTAHTIIISGWYLGSASFTVDPSFHSAITLDSGMSKEFKICFTSDSLHPEMHDSLILSWHYDGQTEEHHSGLALSGTWKSSEHPTSDDMLTSDPHEYSFGSLAVGASACKEFVIHNSSTTSDVTISGYHDCENSAFTITPAFDSSVVLGPGQSMTIKVCYAPSVAGSSASCNLTIAYSNDNPNSDTKQLVISLSGQANEEHNTNTACLHFEQGQGTKDPIALGASASRTLQLINLTGADIVITTDSLACEDWHAFTLDAQLPVTVAAHSTVNFAYTFTPFAQANGNPKESYSACIIFRMHGDSITCTDAHATIIGLSHHDEDNHSTDTVVRPLYPNEPRTIMIESHSDHPTKTFYFTNNLSVDVTVNGVSLSNGQYFEVQSTSPSTPTTLKPNENMTVTIAYLANDNALHLDTLLINSTHNLVAPSFVLQGVKAATSSVRAEIPDGVSIVLTPNPMSSQLRASVIGARNASIEIYDLLGTRLTSASVLGTWTWNATTDGGAHVAAGSYIVRISGVSNEGIVFVTSKRIVVTGN